LDRMRRIGRLGWKIDNPTPERVQEAFNIVGKFVQAKEPKHEEVQKFYVEWVSDLGKKHVSNSVKQTVFRRSKRVKSVKLVGKAYLDLTSWIEEELDFQLKKNPEAKRLTISDAVSELVARERARKTTRRR